jgi:predicted ATPase
MTTCQCKMETHSCKFVVVTGGPGAGKTAVLELLRKSMCEHVAILPEAASIIYGGGFLRHDSIIGRLGAQRAILHVQRELEQIILGEGKSAVALCDRGTVDGLAYWPGSEEDFWKVLGTSREHEFQHYSAVIHLRSPTMNLGYNHSNPVRTESAGQALEIDERILNAWSAHPRRFIVESTTDFLTKAAKAVELIRKELPECCRGHRVEGPGTA